MSILWTKTVSEVARSYSPGCTKCAQCQTVAAALHLRNIKECGSVNIINYLTNINFGLGAAESLAEILRELGVSRPLVISDHGI